MSHKREKLAALFQVRAANMAKAAGIASERYQRYAKLPRIVRWFEGKSWPAFLLDDYRNLAGLADAYATTARYLMGVDE